MAKCHQHLEAIVVNLIPVVIKTQTSHLAVVLNDFPLEQSTLYVEHQLRKSASE